MVLAGWQLLYGFLLVLTCSKALAPLDGDSMRWRGCRWISSWARSEDDILFRKRG